MPPAAKSPKKAPASIPDEPGAYPRETIALDDILEAGHNHRLPSKQDEAEINDLMQSIVVAGRVLQAILVYRDVGGKYRRVYGYRRCEAVKRIGWKHIPADIMPSIPSVSEVHHLRAIENLKRKNLTPAEEALAVHELVEAHVPTSSGRADAIGRSAKELGRDVGWIQDRLFVVDGLTKGARDQLSAGFITFALARELVKVADPRKQDDLVKWILRMQSDGPLITVQELRDEMADLDRSLKGVAWDLDVEFAKKPACTGCKYNKASNVTLFGLSEKQAAADPVCINGACFDLKKAKAGELQRQSAEKARARVKSNELDRKDLATLAVAREVAAPGLRPEAMQAYLKAAVPAKKHAAKAVRSKEPAKPSKSPELVKRQAALLKWSEALRKWLEQIDAAVLAATQKDPLKLLMAIAINNCSLWEKHETYRTPYGSYSFDLDEWKKATAPAPEKPVSPELASLLANAGTFEGLKALAQHPCKYQVLQVRGGGPQIAKRIAELFLGDSPTGVKPAPVFEDFLPKELRPQKAEPAAAAKPFYAPGQPVRIISTGAYPKGMIGMSNEIGEDGRVHVISCANGHSGFYEPDRLAPPTKAEVAAYEKSLETNKTNASAATPGNAYAVGDYVVVTASKFVGEVMGYVPNNRNTVAVKLISGAVRPHFEAELRKATPAEIKDFENARKE